MRFAFLPSNDTQCLQTNMRISALRSENRVSTWIRLIISRYSLFFSFYFITKDLSHTHCRAQLSRWRNNFSRSILKRLSFWLSPEILFIKRWKCVPVRYCFLWILARFVAHGRSNWKTRWPGGFLRTQRTVQSNDAFWSMRTGDCVLLAGTRLTNNGNHLHRSPSFIHMNETLNISRSWCSSFAIRDWPLQDLM